MIPLFRDLYPPGLLHVCLPEAGLAGSEILNNNKKRGKSTNSLHWHIVKFVKYRFDFMACCAVEREGLIFNEMPQLTSAASLLFDS